MLLGVWQTKVAAMDLIYSLFTQVLFMPTEKVAKRWLVPIRTLVDDRPADSRNAMSTGLGCGRETRKKAKGRGRRSNQGKR